jgi:Uma2 family endonuclease
MYAPRPWEAEEDQHVILYGMAWQDYEAFLAIRGERSGVRMYYLDGSIEFMSPTKDHENRKTTIARLLEMWAGLTDVEMSGYGSWTLKKEVEEAGAEPDECYIVGKDTSKDVPDLAIEVEWSRSTGLLKHQIYARLGVRELWTLKKDGALVVRVLEKSKYVERNGSKLLPKLDLEWLLSFADKPQAAAVRGLRDALLKKKRS